MLQISATSVYITLAISCFETSLSLSLKSRNLCKIALLVGSLAELKVERLAPIISSNSLDAGDVLIRMFRFLDGGVRSMTLSSVVGGIFSFSSEHCSWYLLFRIECDGLG